MLKILHEPIGLKRQSRIITGLTNQLRRRRVEEDVTCYLLVIMKVLVRR